MAERHRWIDRMRESSQQLLRQARPESRSGLRADDIDIINRLEIFSKLTERQRRQLAQLCIPRRYRQGEVLIRQGDVGLGMFIITSGRVEVYQEQEGTTRQIAILETGQTVGEMALLDDQPRSANVRVLEDCDCLLLTRDGFQGLARQIPELVWGIVSVVVPRFRRIIDSSDLMSPPTQAAAERPAVSSPPAQHSAASTSARPASSGSEASIMRDSDSYEEGNRPGGAMAETPSNATGEDSVSGLFSSLFQLTSASFMLGSTMCIYGLQESVRWTIGEGSVSQKLNQSEQLVSAVADTFEEKMNGESKNILSAFRSLLDSVLSLFG